MAVKVCQEHQATLLVIDLRAPDIDVRHLVAELRRQCATSLHIMATGPHVHEVSLKEAKAAGCDEVVTRGQFERRFRTTVERLAAGDP
jgi:CheY-like chemotaxis protein